VVPNARSILLRYVVWVVRPNRAAHRRKVAEASSEGGGVEVSDAEEEAGQAHAEEAGQAVYAELIGFVSTLHLDSEPGCQVRGLIH
jgi:hypothetical protein